MYFIIETQVMENSTGSSIVTTKATRNEAESEYYRVLQFAAISNVSKHGAILIDDECVPLLHKVYEHPDSEGDDING